MRDYDDILPYRLNPGDTMIVRGTPEETLIVVGDNAGWPIVIGRVVNTKAKFWENNEPIKS